MVRSSHARVESPANLYIRFLQQKRLPRHATSSTKIVAIDPATNGWRLAEPLLPAARSSWPLAEATPAGSSQRRPELPCTRRERASGRAQPPAGDKEEREMGNAAGRGEAEGRGGRSCPYRGEAGTLPACPAIPGAIVVGPRPPVPRRPRRCPVPWTCRISPSSPASSLAACSRPCLTALVRALCRGC